MAMGCGDGPSAARWISDQHADVVLVDQNADKDRRLIELLLNDPELGGAEVILVDAAGFPQSGRLN